MFQEAYYFVFQIRIWNYFRMDVYLLETAANYSWKMKTNDLISHSFISFHYMVFVGVYVCVNENAICLCFGVIIICFVWTICPCTAGPTEPAGREGH